MEENLKEIVEEMKKSTVSAEETKRYILVIKQLLQKVYQNPEEESIDILQQYLEDYTNELEFRGDADKTYYKMLMYEAYKRLLNEIKGNKSRFDSIIKKARKAEEEDNKSSILIGTEAEETMVASVRYIIRGRNVTKEKEILEAIKEEKSLLAEEVRKRMITIIQASVVGLEDYGFIDEYIQTSNETLEELGLSELKFTKRNPIPDEHYDENGRLVRDVEDIGVIDTFSEENLMEMQLEDLCMMTAFWESKYLEARLGVSKAMAVIRELNLWGDILEEDEDVIEKLDNSRIDAILKKDLALTYLSKDNYEITSKMRKQYKRFLEQEGMSYNIPLEEEVELISKEIANLEGLAKDVAILECLIIYQLRSKDLKVKKWGVLPLEQAEAEKIENGIAMVIENRNFRGSLIMHVPGYILEDYLGGAEREFPEYEKSIDSTYSSIMSKLYLPVNKFFNDTVKKAYKENPSSPILADLAGKKVHAGEDR